MIQKEIRVKEGFIGVDVMYVSHALPRIMDILPNLHSFTAVLMNDALEQLHVEILNIN